MGKRKKTLRDDFAFKTELRVDTLTKAQQHLMEERVTDLLMHSPEETTWNLWRVAVDNYVVRHSTQKGWSNIKSIPVSQLDAIQQLLGMLHP